MKETKKFTKKCPNGTTLVNNACIPNYLLGQVGRSTHKRLDKSAKGILYRMGRTEIFQHAKLPDLSVEPDWLGTKESVKIEVEPLDSLAHPHSQGQMQKMMQSTNSGVLTGPDAQPCLFPYTGTPGYPPGDICTLKEIQTYGVDRIYVKNFIKTVKAGNACKVLNIINPRAYEVLLQNRNEIKQATGKYPEEWLKQCQIRKPMKYSNMTPLKMSKYPEEWVKSNQLPKFSDYFQGKSQYTDPFNPPRFTPMEVARQARDSLRRMEDSQRNKLLDRLLTLEKEGVPYITVHQLAKDLLLPAMKIIDWIHIFLMEGKIAAIYHTEKQILYFKVHCPKCKQLIDRDSKYCKICGSKIKAPNTIVSS
ncbi:MAG TPA: hypothetical protein VMV49_18005 [Candidatus Deferrimicrobium sp.]|nr:hypothetical protein [Candidatus Deferrimicrobium sp.]